MIKICFVLFFITANLTYDFISKSELFHTAQFVLSISELLHFFKQIQQFLALFPVISKINPYHNKWWILESIFTTPWSIKVIFSLVFTAELESLLVSDQYYSGIFIIMTIDFRLLQSSIVSKNYTGITTMENIVCKDILLQIDYFKITFIHTYVWKSHFAFRLSDKQDK